MLWLPAGLHRLRASRGRGHLPVVNVNTWRRLRRLCNSVFMVRLPVPSRTDLYGSLVKMWKNLSGGIRACRVCHHLEKKIAFSHGVGGGFWFWFVLLMCFRLTIRLIRNRRLKNWSPFFCQVSMRVLTDTLFDRYSPKIILPTSIMWLTLLIYFKL